MLCGWRNQQQTWTPSITSSGRWGPNCQRSHTLEERIQLRTCQTHCPGTSIKCWECGHHGGNQASIQAAQCQGAPTPQCSCDETLKDDNKLLPLWEGPFRVQSQLSENTYNIEVEPKRFQEVHRDWLKADLPCPKGTYKPLYWTSKYLSDRKITHMGCATHMGSGSRWCT